MSQYFPKWYEPYGEAINVKVVTGIDKTKLAAKSDLACLKAEIDKLDIDKVVPVSGWFK